MLEIEGERARRQSGESRFREEFIEQDTFELILER